MAKGKINLQANDGAVIGLVVPDGLTSGERQIALGTNLSGITAYHLLQGNLAVSASTITQGMNTTLYTGNGSTQSITTGIDMSTQWGNDASETFGGLVWIKNRGTIVKSHILQDTVRGNGYALYTNNTQAQSSFISTYIKEWNANGYTLGSSTDVNFLETGNNYASWNFQTTHRVTGTTNHGQAYECHYNPFTGFTIVKYEGSGIAGHEIPHLLGRKLGFVTIKNLTNAYTWVCSFTENGSRRLTFTTNAETNDNFIVSQYDNYASINGSAGSSIEWNASSNTYILYGWANSYFDESNKLIGNYEVGVYQGTGASGNKVKTRGKPAWLMVKRLDTTGDWFILDNLRGASLRLSPNLADIENATICSFEQNSFTFGVSAANVNVANGQYLYMVAYDTNATGGGSFYEKTTDNAQLQAVNTIIPTAQGIDSNGAKNMIVSKNETITGISLTEGVNYVYWEND